MFKMGCNMYVDIQLETEKEIKMRSTENIYFVIPFFFSAIAAKFESEIINFFFFLRYALW